MGAPLVFGQLVEVETGEGMGTRVGMEAGHEGGLQNEEEVEMQDKKEEKHTGD